MAALNTVQKQIYTTTTTTTIYIHYADQLVLAGNGISSKHCRILLKKVFYCLHALAYGN